MPLLDGRHSTQRDVLFIIIAGLLIFASGIGLRDPWPPDEPRLILIARDMVLGQQWFFPVRAGEYFTGDPPLFMWLIAVFYWLTGSLRVAFLLPSILSGIAISLLVYDLARRLWSREAGIAAVVLLFLTVQFPLQARAAQIDIVVSLWTTLAVYGFVRHLFLGPDWRMYFIASLATGLGVITKGVGFLPWLIFIPYAFALKKHWAGTPKYSGWRWAAGPVIALAAAALWIVPMLVFTSGDPELNALRGEMLWGDSIRRYIAQPDPDQPFWYYAVEVMPLFWAPIVALLPWLIPAWRERIRLRDALMLVLLGWTLLLLIYFQFSPQRDSANLLPALPAAVLAAAPFLTRLITLHRVRIVALFLTLAFTFLGFTPYLYYKLIRPDRGLELELLYQVNPWAGFIAFAVVGVAIALLTRVRHAVAGFAATMFALWMIYGWWLGPLSNASRNGADLMLGAEQIVGADTELGVVRYREKFLLFATRPVTHFGYRQTAGTQELYNAIAWLLAEPSRVLLVDEDLWSKCFEVNGDDSVLFASRRYWHFARQDQVRDDCVGHADESQPIIYSPPHWPDHPFRQETG